MYEKQIETGIRFLDKKIPGWYKKIKLSKLDMKKGIISKIDPLISCGCIGSQLDLYLKDDRMTGDFDLFCDKYKIINIRYDQNRFSKSKRSSPNLGFSTEIKENGETEETWGILTKEWKAAIRKIKKERKE